MASEAIKKMFFQRMLENRKSKFAASKIGDIMGQREVMQETAPFEQGPDETFPGEQPIQGLFDVTQEASPASGLFDKTNPDRYLEAARDLIATGSSSLQKQGMAMLSNIQQANLKGAGAAANKRGELGILDTKDMTGINNKVTDMLKDSSKIYSSAKSLDALKSKGSPAAQVAAVFSFMKALDPTSTVRESEQGQVYSAEGVAGQLASMINKAIGEGGLTSDNFSDIVDTAKYLANASLGSARTDLSGFLNVYSGRMGDKTRESMMERVKEDLDYDLPKGVTDDDITATMESRGMTRNEVITKYNQMQRAK